MNYYVGDIETRGIQTCTIIAKDLEDGMFLVLHQIQGEPEYRNEYPISTFSWDEVFRGL